MSGSRPWVPRPSEAALTPLQQRIISAFGKKPGPSLLDALQQLQQGQRAKTLAPAQRELLERLYDILEEDLAPFDGRVLLGPEKDIDEEEERFLSAALARYEKTMLKAVRAGLSNYPLVKRWVGIRRALGQRQVLRRAKMGLERGVRSPFPKRSRWDVAPTVKELLEKGVTLRSAYRVLANQGRLAPSGHDRPISWQAFYKWAKRQGFQVPGR